jgi:hypothetical protein
VKDGTGGTDGRRDTRYSIPDARYRRRTAEVACIGPAELNRGKSHQMDHFAVAEGSDLRSRRKWRVRRVERSRRVRSLLTRRRTRSPGPAELTSRRTRSAEDLPRERRRSFRRSMVNRRVSVSPRRLFLPPKKTLAGSLPRHLIAVICPLLSSVNFRAGRRAPGSRSEGQIPVRAEIEFRQRCPSLMTSSVTSRSSEQAQLHLPLSISSNPCSTRSESPFRIRRPKSPSRRE